MPQLNPEFFVSQLFWLVITFSFLLVFLWRISLPRINSVLEKRQTRINENIAAAKELQEEAEKIQKLIDSKLQNTKEETSELIKKASEEFQKKASDELEKLDNELNNKIEDSHNKIEKNKSESLKSLHGSITDITKLILTKISNFDFSNHEIENAIKNKRVVK